VSCVKQSLTTGAVHALTRLWVHAGVRVAPGNRIYSGPLLTAQVRRSR
jgi:hypothetical protein